MRRCPVPPLALSLALLLPLFPLLLPFFLLPLAAAFAPPSEISAGIFDAKARAMCAALWGQCGGKGYDGPMCCNSVRGHTCAYQSDWYY